MSVTNSEQIHTRETLAAAKRIVIKIGSSLLTSQEAGIEHEKINSYCAQISTLVGQGKEVVLVSSGAVAEGCKRLGLAAEAYADSSTAGGRGSGANGFGSSLRRSTESIFLRNSHRYADPRRLGRQAALFKR